MTENQSSDVIASPSQPAWKADIEVDVALARRVVAAQFPYLVSLATSVEPFGVGWDNAAFLIDRRFVFRFPRRRIAATLVEREIVLLPLVAGHLPLPISAPCFIGTPSAEYPWDFAGYELIDGKTACSTMLSNEARHRLAEPLAHFLRALHRIDPAPLVARGLTGDELGRLDHDKRTRAVRERLPAVRKAGMEGADAIAAWLESHPPVLLDDAERTVVHGDLYARHVLLGKDLQAKGIIDWGDMHLGDPALDIAIAHLMLPPSAHEAFRAAYGGIDERTWHAARYRAVYHAILEINYGVAVGDRDLIQSGATALGLMRRTLAT